MRDVCVAGSADAGTAGGDDARAPRSPDAGSGGGTSSPPRDGDLDRAPIRDATPRDVIDGGSGDGGTSICVEDPFVMARTVPTGDVVVQYVAADFNRDGRSDLAVMLDGGVLRVLINNGSGDFGPSGEYTVGTRPVGTAAGDVDGDGAEDIVVADYASGQVSVLMNQGDGRFKAPVAYAVGDKPRSLVLGDLDGDSRLDIVVASEMNAAVTTLRNRGDGTFLSPFAFGAAPGHSAIVADVTGDGRLDVLVTDDSATARVFVNQVNGSFKPGTSFSTTRAITQLASADLDGDGRVDIVASAGQLNVFLGKGNGTFKAPATIPSLEDLFDTTVADLDGDGKPDLAAWGDGAAVFLNRGKGTFSDGGYRALLEDAGGVVADLDGDGVLDLGAGAGGELPGTGSLAIFHGRGDGTFVGISQYFTGHLNAAEDVAAGDLDGDGKLDLVTCTEAANGGLSDGAATVFLGAGDGTFSSPRDFDSGGGQPRAVAIADLNGDRMMDMVVGNLTVHGFINPSLGVLLGRGGAAFDPVKTYSVGGLGDVHALTTGQLDADRAPDLIMSVRRESTAAVSRVGIFASHGDGTFASLQVMPWEGYLLATGDFDKDGFTDLVTTGDDAHFDIRRSLGDGTFASPVSYDPTSSKAPYLPAAAVADFDHDGRDDLVVATGAPFTIQLPEAGVYEATLSVYLNRGDGTLGAPTVTRVELPTPSYDAWGTRVNPRLVVGDFDDDGALDVATPTNGYGAVFVFRGLPENHFASFAAFGAVWNSSASVLAANLDGRGGDELVLPYKSSLAVLLARTDCRP